MPSSEYFESQNGRFSIPRHIFEEDHPGSRVSSLPFNTSAEYPISRGQCYLERPYWVSFLTHKLSRIPNRQLTKCAMYDKVSPIEILRCPSETRHPPTLFVFDFFLCIGTLRAFGH